MARHEQFIVGELIAANVTDPAWKDSSVGLSPSIWSDCPRLSMLLDPSSGRFVGDDFSYTNGESFTTAKNYALAGANGTFGKVASAPEGVAILTAPGTDNDECNVNLNSTVGIIKMSATPDWWFETRVKVSQITTAQGVFVGLMDDQVTAGVDFMTDNTMALKVQGLLGFQIIAATDIAAIWQTVHVKAGGARVALNTAAATAAVAYVKLGMKSISGQVSFYVDGARDATAVLTTATNFPVDLYGVPIFATKCGTAAANTLSVDWWYAAQLRA